MSAPRKTQGTPRKKSAPTDAAYIYALQDPESGEVRYVGQCRHPWRRMAAHLFNEEGRRPKRQWLESLRARDLFPLFIILEKTVAQDAHEREGSWITHYAEQGHDLFNRSIPRSPFTSDGPWVSRGLQMAPDMLEAIDGYAAKHRLEKREVLDTALRHFFAQVGQEVRDA